MSDEQQTPERHEPGDKNPEVEARRAFLKKLRNAGATVPAVSLLLATNLKASVAKDRYGGGGGSPPGGPPWPKPKRKGKRPGLLWRLLHLLHLS